VPKFLNRRDALKGGLAAAALALSPPSLRLPGAGQREEPGVLIPFLDRQPATPERPMVQWEELTEWMTPLENFFSVSHYGGAKVDADKWRLEITGLVRQAKSFSLDELKARRRKEITATLECSGNGSAPSFMGAVGNTRWAGTPLAPLLRECGLQRDGIEIVFFGADEKVETIKGGEYPQNFARSLSVTDALQDKIILAYEMDGKPLQPGHGFPLRLIVPGWYGVAWVKWLKRIEVQDRRFMGRFMARDYVTIRGEERPDCTVWRETSVTRLNVKSLVARVMRRPDRALGITGAAWTDGTPLKSVELKIDDGPWVATRINQNRQSPYAWSFWNYVWSDPPVGEHVLVSRIHGVLQPSADDPVIKLKKTYYEASQQYPRRIKIY
jgi:DMSO/TMAO reductase YedYZ molybdopterin-dependent catalytic subunit